MGAFRPIYNEEVVSAARDLTSPLTGDGLTATDMMFCGAANWTIQLSVCGGAVGTVNIQANNMNPIREATGAGNVKYSINKLLNQPSMGRVNYEYNPSFTSYWYTVSSIDATASMALSVPNTAVRWLRVEGAGVSAANFSAVLWAETMNQGV